MTRGQPIETTVYFDLTLSRNQEGLEKAIELAKKAGIKFIDEPKAPAAHAAKAPAVDAPMEDAAQVRKMCTWEFGDSELEFGISTRLPSRLLRRLQSPRLKSRPSFLQPILQRLHLLRSGLGAWNESWE